MRKASRFAAAGFMAISFTAEGIIHAIHGKPSAEQVSINAQMPDALPVHPHTHQEQPGNPIQFVRTITVATTSTFQGF